MNFAQQKNKAINNLLLAALIATPIVLLVLVLFSPGNLINDENNFTYNIPLLAKYGLSARFFNELHNQSPGPLYQLIYYPLECIGIKPIREYRLVNLFFLFGIVYLLFRLMKQESIENSFMKSLLIFVIPVTWVTGGLALTEIPTIFFVLSSLIVFKTALTRPKFGLFLLSVSGLLLGLSIIGRMQFIVVFPMAVYVLIKLKDIDFKSIAAFCICTLLFPVCLVYVWKGLVPPELQSAQSGMNFMYLLFSFGFASFFLLLLYPAWFKIPKAALYLKILSALLVVFFLLNIKFFNMRFMPMQTLGRVLPAS
ncbi:MAG TPA: hypothetical protein VK783_01470, partial [Bacteroidia bacterium]|nr:hypothetical protein [Bacteroidia bacterium]